MVEVDDIGFATCPGFCPEQLTPEAFYKLYPFAIHTPGWIPNCPPISWLRVTTWYSVLRVMAQCTMGKGLRALRGVEGLGSIEENR